MQRLFFGRFTKWLVKGSFALHSSAQGTSLWFWQRAKWLSTIKVLVKINLTICHHCWTGHGTKSSKFVFSKKLRTDFHILKLKSPIPRTWSRLNDFRMSGQQSEWISKAEDIADKVGHTIYHSILTISLQKRSRLSFWNEDWFWPSNVLCLPSFFLS